MTVYKNDIITVWYSCGAASTVALKTCIDKYPDCTILAFNNPVAEESPDNQRFLHDVEKWLNIKINHIISEKYSDCSAVSVWERRGYMSGIHGAPCTNELKIKTRLKWQKENDYDWIVMGFTADEENRHYDMVERGVDNLLPVLIDEGITKADCYQIIKSAGIKLPDMYEKGYPNANCIGCVKATSPTYWNHVRKVHPLVFKERAELSRKLGAKLVRVKGERIYLDELSPDAKGNPLKNMDFECGVYCSK